MPATKDIHSQVILVDEQDREIGTAEKLAAHEQGLLHRAFSIFIFRQAKTANNQSLELLLQQRADSKYHSSGLWTNTCCSHPQPGETILKAAIRRLKEECHLELHALVDVGQFHYTAHFNNGLTENEFDHVLVGYYQHALPTPNPEEIKAYRWISLSHLKAELAAKPQQFTPWLAEALAIAEKSL